MLTPEPTDKVMKTPAERFSGRIFISHTHWDHINTVPFFAPLYVRGNQVDNSGSGNQGTQRNGDQNAKPSSDSVANLCL